MPAEVHPAVSGAEEAAEACWKLAAIAAAHHLGAGSDHDVAGRLLGAVDALGVVLRTTAHRLREGDGPPDAAAQRWQAADRALAVVFAELYESIPEDEPARDWFARYDRN
ncbi:hypothetical protein AB0J03_21755 [Streptomyces microflavus]|uniref:hypothetical protein n=1 Tax=Streptomyces microflavus TaxID=1919 RepID=UPI0033F53826